MFVLPKFDVFIGLRSETICLLATLLCKNRNALLSLVAMMVIVLTFRFSDRYQINPKWVLPVKNKIGNHNTPSIKLLDSGGVSKFHQINISLADLESLDWMTHQNNSPIVLLEEKVGSETFVRKEASLVNGCRIISQSLDKNIGGRKETYNNVSELNVCQKNCGNYSAILRFNSPAPWGFVTSLFTPRLTNKITFDIVVYGCDGTIVKLNYHGNVLWRTAGSAGWPANGKPLLIEGLTPEGSVIAAGSNRISLVSSEGYLIAERDLPCSVDAIKRGSVTDDFTGSNLVLYCKGVGYIGMRILRAPWGLYSVVIGWFCTLLCVVTVAYCNVETNTITRKD